MTAKAPPPPDAPPLTEATFCILLCLAGGPRHGYAILKDVPAMSRGRVRLSTGTLYGALPRLLEQGWIERRDEPDAARNGRARKAYALTGQGRRMLQAETARLEQLLEAARLRGAAGKA